MERYSGAMGGPEWPPPQQHPVRQGDGAEAAQAGDRGDAGEHGERLLGICPETELGDIVQVPWSEPDVLG